MKTACPFHTAEVHEWRGTSGFIAEVRRRVRVVDLLLISAVPVALLAVHSLPMDARQTLAFRYSQPELLTAYTSNFVHLTDTHLIGNLGGYLLVVPTAYLLSVLSTRRRHFRLTFGIVIGVCPFVISFMQLPFRAGGLGLGFSGLVMAFYGYASLVFVGYLATRLITAVHLDHAPLVFFTQIAAITVITIPPATVSIGVVGISLLIVAIYLAVLLRSFSESTGAILTPEVHHAGYTEITAFTVLVVAFFLVIGFTGGQIDGVNINQLSHFVGFASGFLVSYTILRIDCSLSHVYHCAGPDTDCQLHDSPGTRFLRWILIIIRYR